MTPVLIVGAQGPHARAVAAALRPAFLPAHFPEPFTAAEYRGHSSRFPLAIAVKCHTMLPLTPKLLVIHDSLLPRWRGFAPTAHGILAGDTEFGVSLFEATDVADAGPLLAQRSLHDVPHGATAAQIQRALVPLYAAVARTLLPGYSSFGNSFPNDQHPTATLEQIRKAEKYE